MTVASGASNFPRVFFILSASHFRKGRPSGVEIAPRAGRALENEKPMRGRQIGRDKAWGRILRFSENCFSGRVKVFERCVCSSKTRGNVQNVEIGGGKSNPTGEIAGAIRCGSTWVTGIAQPTVCKDPKRERKALLSMIALFGMQ